MRRALRLKQGDVVQFEIDGDRVTLRRQRASDRAYLRGLESTLSEWRSPYDEEAYGDESLILARIGALATADRRAVARSLRSAIAR